LKNNASYVPREDLLAMLDRSSYVKYRMLAWSHDVSHVMCFRLRYDQVAVTGTLKRDFVNFVRASAVQNFRAKYSKYLENYRTMPPSRPTVRPTTSKRL
uniref:VASt domain-containing protein n=1 Tax=Heligmosomoides polygyrus TaxID=6339 RepID=A0A183GUW9_HELPZ